MSASLQEMCPFIYSYTASGKGRERESPPLFTPPLICSARRGTSPWQPLGMLPPAAGGRQTLYLLNVKVARARMKGRGLCKGFPGSKNVVGALSYVNPNPSVEG